MDKFTKEDIGKPVYFIEFNQDRTGYVGTATIENVSIAGDKVRIVEPTHKRLKELSLDRVAKTREGFLSILSDLRDAVGADCLLYASNSGNTPGYCSFLLDVLVADEYGDKRFSKASNHKLAFVLKYGKTACGMLSDEEFLEYLEKIWKNKLMSSYTMDKATDDWQQCPNCGAEETDLEDHKWRPESQQFSVFRCTECGCRWGNKYEAPKRLERKLLN